jgi:hypothetical protein
LDWKLRSEWTELNGCQDIVAESASSKTKEETTNNLGALAALRALARTDRRKMVVRHLDQLVQYHEAALNEQS